MPDPHGRRQGEAERRRAKAIKDSREELLGIIETWNEAKRIKAFSGMLARGRAQRPKRLGHARELLGGIDALQRFLTWKAPENQFTTLPK